MSAERIGDRSSTNPFWYPLNVPTDNPHKDLPYQKCSLVPSGARLCRALGAAEAVSRFPHRAGGGGVGV